MSKSVTPGATPARKKAKYKRPKRKKIPDELWEEMKVQYETGSYSQRALVNYAKAKGYSITQSAISAHAINNNWVKGAIRDEIRDRIMEDVRKKIGNEIADMLDLHTKQARLIQSEAMRYFVHAESMRANPATPDYKMPVNQIATIAATLDRAQDMHARAMGWNYKEGRPFKHEDDDDAESAIEKLHVRMMTPDEEAEIRRQQSEEYATDNEAQAGEG